MTTTNGTFTDWLWKTYDRRFVGADDHEKAEAIETINSVGSRRIVIDILDRYSKDTVYDDIALLSLRAHATENLRVLKHKWRGEPSN